MSHPTTTCSLSDWVFYTLGVLHDAKQLKKRHTGFFAANLVAEPGRHVPHPTTCPAHRFLLNLLRHTRNTVPTAMLSGTLVVVAIILHSHHNRTITSSPTSFLSPLHQLTLFPARPDNGKEPPDTVKNFGRGGHHTPQPPQQNQPPPLLDYQSSQVFQPASSRRSQAGS